MDRVKHGQLIIRGVKKQLRGVHIPGVELQAIKYLESPC